MSAAGARYVPSLSGPEIEQATRHTYTLWGTGRSQEAHTAHNLEQLRRAGPELLRYAGLADDSGLVASMKRYGLLLRRGDATVPALGVGAVFTRPDARKRGLAAEMIRIVLAEGRDLGCEAAILFSEIEPTYYARLGFVALPAIDHFARVDALPNAGVLRLRPAGQHDVDQLVAWHEERFRDGPARGWLRPARTPALWRYFTWRNRLGAAWILSDGGRELGYLIGGLDDPLRDMPEPRAPWSMFAPLPPKPALYWIDEWSAPGVPTERVLATIHALAAAAPASLVGGWLPPDPESDPAMAAFAPAPRPTAFPMVAPLEPSLAIDPARTFLGSFEHF